MGSFGGGGGGLRLKTNARALPKRSRNSTRAHRLPGFPFFLKAGYCSPRALLHVVPLAFFLPL